MALTQRAKTIATTSPPLSFEIVDELIKFMRDHSYFEARWNFKVLSSTDNADRNVAIGIIQEGYSAAISDIIGGQIKARAEQLVLQFVPRLKVRLGNDANKRFMIKGSRRCDQDRDVLYVLYVKRKTIDDSPTTSIIAVILLLLV